jgi:hypothetical protein
MKTSVVTQISIKAKPAEVFEYLTNLKYHYLWNPQVQSLSSAESLKLGSEYESVSLVLGVKIRAKNVVSKFTSSKELELENKTGLVKYRASFRLQRAGSSTLLICSTTVSADSEAFAFAKPVLRMLARRELQTDLQALKIAVENKLNQKTPHQQ